ncbi:hypothetical protein K1Y37_15285 [Serratia marcescens]|uniref:hypothetical protein n=1 Tax=Serratia TaxID=613 RepID=UPI002238AC98|nr:hypothetical protein [Serratia marcescens]MCW6024182.1 hypothetical protein [Serratia marcescens]BEM40700.1 hypothetical protein SME10J_44270 [Serratia marcescens]
MKRFTPDCSMHMSHEIAFMRETPDGAYMEYQDHLPVKAQRDNLAIRVTELEKRLIDLKPERYEMRYWSGGYHIWGEWEGISPELFARLSVEHARDNDYEFRVLYAQPNGGNHG